MIMTNAAYDTLTQVIQARRAVFPNLYNGESIVRADIEQVLLSANWAPTHRRTEPWRFQVFTDEAKRSLGAWLAEDYRNQTTSETFNSAKYEKPIKKMRKSGAVIAIVMQRDPDERVPEWEEIAAVSCAVQNMWLTCTAMGIGCYWSTPGAIERIGDFLELEKGQRCLGLFYMGHWDPIELPATRGPIDDKVQWKDS